MPRSAYALSARAVRRMTELAGTPAIVALLGDLGRGVPFDRAFRDRLSIRYDTFQAGLASKLAPGPKGPGPVR